MIDTERNYVDIYEDDEKATALAYAVDVVQRSMRNPNSTMCRSWITKKKLRNAWLASDDPFNEFPENAEYWVAHYYDRQFPRIWGAYAEHYGRRPGWPETRGFWDTDRTARKGNLDNPRTPPRPY